MVYCLSHNLCPKNNSHWLAFQTVANLPTVIVLQGSSAKPHNLILTKCSCFFFVFIFCFSFWMNIYLNQWKYFWGKNSSASSSSSSSSSTPVSSSLTLQTQQSLSSWCWHICVSLKTQSELIWWTRGHIDKSYGCQRQQFPKCFLQRLLLRIGLLWNNLKNHAETQWLQQKC